MKLTVKPLTPGNWPDLEKVFNARGCAVARGCWCMYYRRSGASPGPTAGMTRAARNRADLAALARADTPPGLVGYRDRTPIGWISLGPRQDYAKLARSPVMKPVDDARVWSIICFVVPSAYRGQGVARALLAAAVAWARKRGVTLLEAYPVDREGRAHDDTMWFGAKSMFDDAGFAEVARRKSHRPVVRLRLQRSAGAEP
ncbi:MAG TPA: GNAT family N-acetyltransferase [Casimicrobiaceae bacterium]|jgi:GNAT superfamily N-acetyltransferase